MGETFQAGSKASVRARRWAVPGTLGVQPEGSSEGNREDEEMRLRVRSPMMHTVSHGRNFRFYRNPLESLNSGLSNSTSNLNGGNKLCVCETAYVKSGRPIRKLLTWYFKQFKQ